MLSTAAGWARVVVDLLLMVLYDEVWREVSVLLMRSLLMRSSGQTASAARRLVPRR